MFAAPSLLSQLRRRLIGVRWLFAMLLLVKLALGTACLAADGEAVNPVAGTQLQWATVSDADPSGDCWHEGSGGCHCNCTHATPLASTCGVSIVSPVASSRFVMPRAGMLASPWRNPLRPPIA